MSAGGRRGGCPSKPPHEGPRPLETVTWRRAFLVAPTPEHETRLEGLACPQRPTTGRWRSRMPGIPGPHWRCAQRQWDPMAGWFGGQGPSDVRPPGHTSGRIPRPAGTAFSCPRTPGANLRFAWLAGCPAGHVAARHGPETRAVGIRTPAASPAPPAAASARRPAPPPASAHPARPGRSHRRPARRGRDGRWRC